MDHASFATLVTPKGEGTARAEDKLHLDSRIEEIEADVRAVEACIGAVENVIKDTILAKKEADQAKQQELREELQYLRKEKEQLRKEKEQLRKEKEQLRDKELLLLRQTLGAADSKLLETVVEGVSKLQGEVSEVRQLVSADKAPRLPKGFSTVGSREAGTLLASLEFDEDDGNAVCPIEVPSDAPRCAEFDYTEYPSENAGGPHFLRHHQEQLAKFDVWFGEGGFHVYDLHQQTVFSLLTSTGQSYEGSVDGAVAPFGLTATGASRQLRICYEHKQTGWQRAEYRRQHEFQEEENCNELPTDRLRFRGGNKGQAITELLAAYSVNNFPLLLDLTDGIVHHLLSLTGSALVTWENLTPTEAYYKQAQVLKTSRLASSRHLRMADLPEEDASPLKKMREMRPQNGLLEQLACLEDLPVDTRVETALDLIHSWSHISPPLLPMPQAVANFYA